MAKFCFLVIILLISLTYIDLSNAFLILNITCDYEVSGGETCDFAEIGCDNADWSPGNSQPNGLFDFPSLSGLSLAPENDNLTNDANSILHLRWNALESGNFPNQTEKFFIRFSLGHDDQACVSIQLHTHVENAAHHRAHFSVQIGIPSDGLGTNGPNMVEWISEYSGQSVACEISYPESLERLYTQSPQHWQTVFATTPLLFPSYTIIHIVFQAAPNLQNITYLVNVSSPFGNWSPNSLSGDNGVVQESVRVSHNDTVYEVTVYVQKDPICVHHDCLAVASRVYMPLYVEPAATTDGPDPITADPPTSDKGGSNNNSNNNVKIGVGVAVGGICIAVIVGLVLYFVCKRRNKSIQNHFSMQKLEGESSEPHPPSVLILYSADCPAHEQVVIELASFIREEWRIDVYLDLWDQKAILDRGWLQWMNEKLIEAQYVLIICSTGARYKFARNRQFRLKYDRAVPDMFVSAVDHVLERCYVAKQPNTGINSPECLVGYFEYAGESDIPPKLDKTKRFLLMEELCDLYNHISKTATDKLSASELCLSDTKYKYTKSGKQLHSVLVKAMEFFTDNPDWLGELLEPMNTADSSPQKQNTKDKTENDKSSSKPVSPPQDVNESPIVDDKEPLSSPPQSEKTNPADTSSHSRMSSSATEEDALLEERQKRRRKEEEAKMQRVPSSQDTTKLVNVPNDKMVTTTPSINSPRSSTINSPVTPAKMNGLAKRRERILQSPSTCEDIDEEQMKLDLDFIHNFDMHHSSWYHPANPSDVLIDMDFSACTPPENVPLSETYKSFMYANSGTRNGLNDFVNPTFFAMEGIRPNGLPDLKKLPHVKSDKNDNVIIDFEIPGDQFNKVFQTNHCDTSTDL